MSQGLETLSPSGPLGMGEPTGLILLLWLPAHPGWGEDAHGHSLSQDRWGLVSVTQEAEQIGRG